MHSVFHVSHSYVFPPPLRLTWLADPALVTSVYPNRMQYTSRVLQEASLLDGVDAGVRGNGRRFSKTSSYPPCRRYALIFFYPYLLTTSLSPLFSLIHSFPMTHFHPATLTDHSHTPYRPCFLCLTKIGKDFPLRTLQLSWVFVRAALRSVYNVLSSGWTLPSFVILGIPLPYYAPVF